MSRGFALAAAVAGLMLGCGHAQAQTPGGAQSWPPPGVSFYGDPSVTDLSGVWLGQAMGVPGSGRAETNSGTTSDGRPPAFWAPWPLPFTPEYQKIFDERVAATKKGVALGDIGSRCLPFGLPMMIASKVYPEEVVQTPGQTTIFTFGTFPITIWTDGRAHPKDWKPSYNGHSIGQWVGDTLFVDTIGILPTTSIDTMRNPHSAKLHMKWSIQKMSKDVLHLRITLIDDDALTEPVAMTQIWHRQTDRKWEVPDDASCFENNTHISEKPAEEGFIKF